jgi:exonuclease SbcC
MILKSVKLENIRSYLNQTIEFPTGSVLLSGDIGSGKSTILLAIEFSLFGVRRKDLSGASLLRHGKKQGSVELKFSLDGKEIIIKRVLKRGKEDVKQEAGYIVTNGIKKEGTHVELKSSILDVLGYPRDLITKSKDLIYRYTVYTPQEAMKQILMEDKDVRLDTLRKVFNIDKYKRIRENSQIFIKELREKRKNYEGQIDDLEEKKKLKDGVGKELSTIEEKLKELLPQVDSVNKEVKQKKELIDKTEKQIKEFNKINNELELEELKLRNYVDKRKSNKNEVEKLIKEIESIKKDLEKEEIKNLEEFLRLVKDKETQLGFFQKTIIEITKKLSEFETKIRHSKETKEKISKLDKCPICLQDVGEDHKKSIHGREDKNISELEEHINSHKKQDEENKTRLEILEKEIKELRKKQSEIKAIMVKKEALKEKDNRRETLEKEQEKMKSEIGKINVKKIDLNKEIEKLKGIEKEYKKAKQEFDLILKKERELEINKKEFEVKKEEILKLIKSLEEEINKKLQIKKSLGKISSYQNWIEGHFVKLMSTIEKHVMLQVYREFNDLFQQWFNMLMEDETLNVRLDDEFTPVIEQNGYETNVGNLSGGERTAVALAYRLALNKVINDVVGEIKTKNILLLDEPTDGFSTEQLDKVRDVLEQLNIKQVIMVSHESKIESFVDSVIRINKNEHVSGVS